MPSVPKADTPTFNPHAVSARPIKGSPQGGGQALSRVIADDHKRIGIGPVAHYAAGRIGTKLFVLKSRTSTSTAGRATGGQAGSKLSPHAAVASVNVASGVNRDLGIRHSRCRYCPPN